MQIVVRNTDPSVAHDIADKMLQIIPDVIVEKVEVGSVKAVEQAYANPNPVSPNILKNTVIMAALGFVASCAMVVILTLADNTYKNDLEIQNHLNIPVLGVIPTVESCKGKKGYKYGYRYGYRYGYSYGYGYGRKSKGDK
jgi:capsular polysaccharide biosynthesis protein